MNPLDEVRVDFALIPADPLFKSVIKASQAITDEFYYNENVIDETTFPPHLSLHICTIPAGKIEDTVERLRDLASSVELPSLVPLGVNQAYGGYIMLDIERTSEIMAAHEAVLEIAATVRDNPSDKYGNSYIHKSFNPHISLAKVDRDDISEAEQIGRNSVVDWASLDARSQAIDLCDIGMNSEKWLPLVSLQG